MYVHTHGAFVLKSVHVLHIIQFINSILCKKKNYWREKANKQNKNRGHFMTLSPTKHLLSVQAWKIPQRERTIQFFFFFFDVATYRVEVETSKKKRQNYGTFN